MSGAGRPAPNESIANNFLSDVVRVSLSEGDRTLIQGISIWVECLGIGGGGRGNGFFCARHLKVQVCAEGVLSLLVMFSCCVVARFGTDSLSGEAPSKDKDIPLFFYDKCLC